MGILNGILMGILNDADFKWGFEWVF